MEIQYKYTDVNCLSLEGKEKFLCLMTKEIFWFDKPELSFGVYKVFRKKQRLIENVLKEVIKSIENSLNEKSKFESLKNSIYEELEAELDARQKRKIKNSDNKENLKTILRKIKENYESDLREIENEDEKVEIQKIIEKIEGAINKVENVQDITSEDIYNHLYGFFSLYYNKGDFGYTKNRYSVYQVSYKEKDFIKKENIEHKACESSAMEEYDGSDVLFRWQNWDTYYIKTLKYAKDYEIKDLEIFGKHINIKLSIDIENSEQPEGSKEQKLKLNGSYYDKSKNLLILKFILSKDETPIEEIANEILKLLNIKAKAIKVKNPLTDKEAEIEIKKILEKGIKKVLTSRKSFLDEIGFPDKTKVNTKEEIDKVFEENKGLNAFWKLLRGITLFKEGTDSDYFIHKNLKRFLTKELDKYIKNIIFADTDDLLNNPNMWNKTIKIAKLFKENAEKIINILSQMEDFQKKLWELRKLVKKAEYVISSKEIKDEEILKLVLNNEKQKRDWEELKIPLPKNINDLKEKSYPIDTKHFTFEEKYIILSVIENLEEKINGILIKSENFQALKFLEPKYTEKIKTIYIDPPYNTGNDGFLYKDKYKHSSWLTMMENRLKLAKSLMKDDGAIFISIDDNEINNLKNIMESLYGEENFVDTFIIRSNPRGNQAKKITASEHEYMLCYAKEIKKLSPLGFLKNIEDYDKEDEYGRYREIGLRKRGAGARREDAPNQYFPIFYNEKTKEIDVIKKSNEDIEIFPKLSDGTDGRWRWSKEKVKENINNLLVRLVKRNGHQEYDVFEKDYYSVDKIAKIKSIFYEKEVNYENATEELKRLFLKESFKYSKPTYLIHKILQSFNEENSLVLDFFSGSGTTGHAIALLNTKNVKEIIEQILDLKKKIKTLKSEKAIKEKEKEIKELKEQLENIEFENRKYILAEINDYFDTVIIPRMKKLMYSLVWKDGEPQYPFGYSHIFKYLYLEQYEDLLEIYGNLNINQDNKDTEYIFSKDFNELTNIRIKPLIKEPIDNKNYDLLETYLFHNNLDLVKVKYEDEILTADVKDKYDNNILILLSNNKNKLIDFINEKDLSDYNKVIVNLDLPDEAKIENNIEKIHFIKTSDLAGV